jgi:hypothetical protein
MVAIAFLIHVVEVLYIHLFHKSQIYLLKQKYNIPTECGVPYLRPAKYLFDLSDRSLNCWHMICSCFSLSICSCLSFSSIVYWWQCLLVMVWWRWVCVFLQNPYIFRSAPKKMTNVVINSVPQLYLYLLRGVSNRHIFPRESTRQVMKQLVRKHFRANVNISNVEEQQVMLHRATSALQYMYNL